MADENSVYNITEYDNSVTYAKDDVVAVFERFTPSNVPKSVLYYYSTSNNNSGNTPNSDSALWGGLTKIEGKNKPKFMKAQGFPSEPDVTKPNHTTVFSFPMASPENAVCRKDMTALEQLELWKVYAQNWCEHKPSVTISVKEDEWVDTAAWVYENFDEISGISFLPFSDHTYKQAPYQDCTEQEYTEMMGKMPKNVDWSKLSEYEQKDFTVASQELACSAGVCEVVDLPAS